MKLNDIIIIGLASLGIYYLGKRLLSKKRAVPAVTAKAPSQEAEMVSNNITVVQPSVTQTDMDIVGWVANS